MLVIKLILSFILLLINRSNWYLSFLLLLANPLVPIIYSYIISNNYFIGSNDIMTNSIGLAIYATEKTYLYAYDKINTWYNQPQIKDNFFMKMAISCLFFVYKCLKYIDDAFKSYMIKQIINAIKFISFNAVLYIKSNPEQLQKVLNQTGRPIDAKFICSMIPDPYLLSESLNTNSLQTAYENDMKKLNKENNLKQTQSDQTPNQSTDQKETSKISEENIDTNKQALNTQIPLDQEKFADPMYQMPFFATNFLLQNPSSLINLSKSIKTTIEQSNKQNTLNQTKQVDNQTNQINMHQLTTVMQSNIKFINSVKEVLSDENVKSALKSESNKTNISYSDIEQQIKDTEQQINLFLLKCTKNKKKESRNNKLNSILSEIKSDNAKSDSAKADYDNSEETKSENNIELSTDSERNSSSNSDEFHIVDQMQPVD